MTHQSTLEGIKLYILNLRTGTPSPCAVFLLYPINPDINVIIQKAHIISTSSYDAPMTSCPLLAVKSTHAPGHLSKGSHYCNIIVSVPFIYMQVTSHLMLILYSGRMSRFLLLMNRDKHHLVQFQFQFQMQTLFQHYSLQPKPEFTSGLFLIHIYIYSYVLIPA